MGSVFCGAQGRFGHQGPTIAFIMLEISADLRGSPSRPFSVATSALACAAASRQSCSTVDRKEGLMCVAARARAVMLARLEP